MGSTLAEMYRAPTFLGIGHPATDLPGLDRLVPVVEVRLSVGFQVVANCGRRLSVMSRVREHYDWDEVEALFASVEPSTTDDVSITDDGRRLDSAPAVRAFFDELRASRAAGANG